ncbi:MAG: ribbon-helix-helix domain-containing protein [Candidatus Nanohaloarchaea archaeon]
MASINVRLPDEQKEQVEEAAERGNYPSPSEWVREAIRDKLKEETVLYPEEVERILKIWEKEKKGDMEWVPAEEVWEEVEE